MRMGFVKGLPWERCGGVVGDSRVCPLKGWNVGTLAQRREKRPQCKPLGTDSKDFCSFGGLVENLHVEK